jgi:hypothetical protein
MTKQNTTAKVEDKVPVSERALIQRINRKIHDDELVVRTTRGGRAEIDLGRHYVVNWRINGVHEANINLEDYGRKLEVLEPWERLVTEQT